LKKLISIVLLTVTIFTVILNSPVLAADLATGTKVFSANCAACHAGGGNVVNSAKTLKKGALEENGMASPDAIISQVTNGKAAMPSFKGRLSPEEIESVAAYVLGKADSGW
jgi:cytochrome c6